MSDKSKDALSDFSEEDMAWAERRYALLEPVLRTYREVGDTCAIVGVIDPLYETDLVNRSGKDAQVRGRALALCLLLQSKGFQMTTCMENLDVILEHTRGCEDCVLQKSLSALPPFEKLFNPATLHRQLRLVLIASW